MPIFHHNEKVLLFSHIPKTGGTSVEKYLTELGLGIQLWSNKLHGPRREGFPASPQHWHRAIIHEIFPGIQNEFAIVRHPVDRLISEYRHRARNFTNSNNVFMTFDQWFIFALDKYRRNKYVFDNHLRPQSDFVNENTNVFYFENGLHTPLEYACKFFGVKETEALPHKNKGEDIEITGLDNVIDLIVELYECDFKKFGYEV